MMEENISNDKFGLWKRWFLILIVVVAMIVIIAFAVSQISYKTSPKTGVVSQTQNTPPVPPTEVRRVLGTVEQISGQEITLKDFRKISSVVSTISDQSARMVVGVDQSTIIERFTHKDAAVFSAEFDAFYKNIQKIQAQNPSTPPASPEPFTLEKVAIGDIKVGDSIMASFAEDISKLTIFTATKIEVRK